MGFQWIGIKYSFGTHLLNILNSFQLDLCYKICCIASDSFECSIAFDKFLEM